MRHDQSGFPLTVFLNIINKPVPLCFIQHSGTGRMITVQHNKMPAITIKAVVVMWHIQHFQYSRLTIHFVAFSLPPHVMVTQNMVHLNMINHLYCLFPASPLFQHTFFFYMLVICSVDRISTIQNQIYSILFNSFQTFFESVYCVILWPDMYISNVCNF
ncbi:hypothetical protein D3C85_1127880 [compost metagenome]